MCWRAHHTDMDRPGMLNHHECFALWHIPSSTLLVRTDMPGEVLERIEVVTSSGLVLDELMLDVERDGALMGTQHLGAGMLAVLQRYG